MADDQRPRHVVLARRRPFSGLAGPSAISCMRFIVLVLLVVLLAGASVATARPVPIPVLVRANLSNRRGTTTVRVAIRSVASSTCQLTVSVDKRSVSFPAMIADPSGSVVVTWQVPAHAPSGHWVFDVSCTKGKRAGRGNDRAAVLARGGKGAGHLVASSSSQLIQGDLAANGVRVLADSYARSCSADVCFADDPLWRMAGQSTWYAAGRRPDLDGIVNGNAGDWPKEARGRIPEGVSPAVGAIAVWLPDSGGASSAGHVAYVAGVSGVRVLVEDSNWGEPSLLVHRHWVPAASISDYIYEEHAGAGPSTSASTLTFASAEAPNSPSLDTPPPPNADGRGDPGPGDPPESTSPEDSPPTFNPAEVSGAPEEPPSESKPSPPSNSVEATLPPPPTMPQPESLESILPQAQQIMAQSGTVWSRAAAVRNLVRASMSHQNDCAVMAMAFWSVGSIVGLPLRIVDSSANGQNTFDTHSTVEVWLAGPGRWAISDPTFNGYWTAGPEGPPVSAEFMQRALLADASNILYWHGAGTPNSISPSQYYVDPTYLYRYIDFRSYVPSLGVGFMVNSEVEAFSAPNVFVPTTTTDFESLPPNAQTPVAAYKRTETPSSAGASGFTLPPSYADALVYEGQVTVGPDRRVPIPLAEQSSATVMSVDTGSGHWQMEIGGRTTYNLDPYPKARVSPIVFFRSPVDLVTSEPVSQPLNVRVWTVRDFPPSHEVTSQWDGG
jgi:surface antigen